MPPPRGRTIDGISLYWFYNPSRPVCVIRDGDYSLIADPDIELSRDNMFLEEYIGPIQAAKLVRFRLYNLRNDPGQKNDLAEENRELYETLKRKMLALHADVMAEAHDWRQH